MKGFTLRIPDTSTEPMTDEDQKEPAVQSSQRILRRDRIQRWIMNAAYSQLIPYEAEVGEVQQLLALDFRILITKDPKRQAMYVPRLRSNEEALFNLLDAFYCQKIWIPNDVKPIRYSNLMTVSIKWKDCVSTAKTFNT